MAQRRNASSGKALAEQPEQGFEEHPLVEHDSIDRADVVAMSSTGTEHEATPASGYEGRLLGLENDKIVGWAWDQAKPYDVVSVELFIGELRVGGGLADHFDIDLAKAKRGNGIHRFELGLDRLPSALPPFQLRAVIAGTDTELLPPITLTSLETAERLVSATEYMGKVTGIVDGMLCGWVLNWLNPHEEPLLALHDGDAEVLTRMPTGRTTAVISAGVTVNAHRFELPLPANVLDGRQHILSVRAGASAQELRGSPVMFGPTDIASIGWSLANAFERLQQLDRRVSSLQPALDNTLLERRIATGILDRVDMLLNIHRDGLERELALLRRQVSELVRLLPDVDPDVILPTDNIATIEDEPVPTETSFNVIARSAPLLSYDLEVQPPSVKPSGGLSWLSDAGAYGISIGNSGRVELDGVPPGPASLILKGTGAFDPFEFCGIVPAYHGHALTGRVEIRESGNWTFMATTMGGSVDPASENGFSITYLPEIAKPSGQLHLRQIAVLHRGRLPDRIDVDPPDTAISYVGTESGQGGWYSVETGARGGLCWMGAHAELAFRLSQSGSYRLRIPEIRPLVPDIISKLQISLGGVPVSLSTSPTRGDHTVYEAHGDVRVPNEESGLLTLRLSFPDESVRSPHELGLNDDQRPLSIAVRSIALSAIKP